MATRFAFSRSLSGGSRDAPAGAAAFSSAPSLSSVGTDVSGSCAAAPPAGAVTAASIADRVGGISVERMLSLTSLSSSSSSSSPSSSCFDSSTFL